MKRGFLVVLSVGMVLALSVLPVNAHITQVPPHVAVAVFTGAAGVAAPGVNAPVSQNCGTPVGVCASGVAPGTWTFAIAALPGTPPGTPGGVGGHYAPPPGSTGAGGILVGGNTLPGGAQVVAGTFATPAPGIVGDLVWGTGGYGAWCGYSGGNDGAGAIAFAPLAGATLSPPAAGLGVGAAATVNVTEVGWVQSAGTVIPFNGLVIGGTNPAYHGTIHGLVSAIPPNSVTGGAGSCVLAGPSATGFTIVGLAAAIWQD